MDHIGENIDSAALTGTVRRIAGLAVTYTVGDIFIKGLNYLLLPLYLRFLSPEEYGIIAITEVLKIILGLVLSFGMTGAILRFTHTVEEKDKRSFFGSIWIFLILIAGLVTALLLIFGPPLFAKLIPSVAFEPYISKTILAAFLTSSFALLPATMFRARDQAKQYVIFGLFSSMSIVLVTIVRVVILKQEAAGWVQAQLEGAVGIALIASIILLLEVRLSFNWKQLRSALLFSLPLVPHFIAHWVLSVSDRMILERYVGLTQLGIYTLGYQFGQGYQILVTGINNALIPQFGRAAKRESERQILPDMTTYYLLTVAFLALVIALIGGEVIRLVFPPKYEGAVFIVPWIVLGYLAFAIYNIPMSYLIMTTGETKSVPLATLLAAVVNLALNLLFIPAFGLIAAAVNTAIGYAVLALSLFTIARRAGPLPLQLERIAKLGSSSVMLYIMGRILMRFHPYINLTIGLGLSLSLPILLSLLGFWRVEEIRKIRISISQVFERLIRVKG